jgi:hypothetical protein
VAPLTAAFPRNAIHTGTRQRLDDRSARLIAASCAADATPARCVQARGPSKERMRRLIGSGLRTLWEHPPPELQAQYPWEAVPKSKDLQARQREALKARWHDSAYRVRMIRNEYRWL